MFYLGTAYLQNSERWASSSSVKWRVKVCDILKKEYTGLDLKKNKFLVVI